MAVLESAVTRSSTDRAWELYYRLRPQIETPDNIGKLILLDLDSGDYEIAQDELGFAASALLRERNPSPELFAHRIGYKTATSFCGNMERLPE